MSNDQRAEWNAKAWTVNYQNACDNAISIEWVDAAAPVLREEIISLNRTVMELHRRLGESSAKRNELRNKYNNTVKLLDAVTKELATAKAELLAIQDAAAKKSLKRKKR